jgi:hypothetical protein
LRQGINRESERNVVENESPCWRACVIQVCMIRVRARECETTRLRRESIPCSLTPVDLLYKERELELV